MNVLRPKKLDNLIGQDDIKRILNISIESAKQRKDVLPHILISSTQGQGKSTLAECIANETGGKFHYANSAALKNIKKISPYLLTINHGDVFFVDETHRLLPQTQEFLYNVLEDFFCVYSADDEIIKLKIPKFTFIAATTEIGSLTRPFRDRFKIHLTFSCYKDQDLAKLALQNSAKLNIGLTEDAALEIAKRSRGTPRILNRNLEWCRDYSLSKNSKEITQQNVIEAMRIAKINKDGFTFDDQRYLLLLKKASHPIPLNVISSIIGVNEKTIQDEIEPYLIHKGLILKTTKGRQYCGK